MPWIKDSKKRNRYYEITKTRNPSPLLLKSLKLSKIKAALDLGCGAGVDVKEMVRRGIKVTAVDVNPEVKKYFSEEELEKVKLVITPFHKFKFGKYDLVYSRMALPFQDEDKFFITIKKIKGALNNNGLFAARVLGEKDSGKLKGRIGTFLSEERVRKLFKGFEFLEYKEIEKDGETTLGQKKHWHIFQFIVQKQ